MAKLFKIYTSILVAAYALAYSIPAQTQLANGVPQCLRSSQYDVFNLANKLRFNVLKNVNTDEQIFSFGVSQMGFAKTELERRMQMQLRVALRNEQQIDLFVPSKFRKTFVNMQKNLLGRTAIKFPFEAFKFYLTLGAIAFKDIWLDYAYHPLAIEQNNTRHLEPITYVSFFAFMLVNGAVSEPLMEAIQKPALRMFVPYLGMPAGMFASDLVSQIHSQAPELLACYNSLVNPGQNDQRGEPNDNGQSTCDKAYTNFVNKSNSTLFPGLTSLMASAAVASIAELAVCVSGSTGGSFINTGAKLMTTRAAAFGKMINGIEIFFSVIPETRLGMLGMSGLRWGMTEIPKLMLFLLADDWLRAPMEFLVNKKVNLYPDLQESKFRINQFLEGKIKPQFQVTRQFDNDTDWDQFQTEDGIMLGQHDRMVRAQPTRESFENLEDQAKYLVAKKKYRDALQEKNSIVGQWVLEEKKSLNHSDVLLETQKTYPVCEILGADYINGNCMLDLPLEIERYKLRNKEWRAVLLEPITNAQAGWKEKLSQMISNYNQAETVYQSYTAMLAPQNAASLKLLATAYPTYGVRPSGQFDALAADSLLKDPVNFKASQMQTVQTVAHNLEVFSQCRTSRALQDVGRNSNQKQEMLDIFFKSKDFERIQSKFFGDKFKGPNGKEFPLAKKILNYSCNAFYDKDQKGLDACLKVSLGDLFLLYRSELLSGNFRRAARAIEFLLTLRDLAVKDETEIRGSKSSEGVVIFETNAVIKFSEAIENPFIKSSKDFDPAKPLLKTAFIARYFTKADSQILVDDDLVASLDLRSYHWLQKLISGLKSKDEKVLGQTLSDLARYAFYCDDTEKMGPPKDGNRNAPPTRRLALFIYKSLGAPLPLNAAGKAYLFALEEVLSQKLKQTFNSGNQSNPLIASLSESEVRETVVTRSLVCGTANSQNDVERILGKFVGGARVGIDPLVVPMMTEPHWWEIQKLGRNAIFKVPRLIESYGQLEYTIIAQFQKWYDQFRFKIDPEVISLTHLKIDPKRSSLGLDNQVPTDVTLAEILADPNNLRKDLRENPAEWWKNKINSEYIDGWKTFERAYLGIITDMKEAIFKGGTDLPSLKRFGMSIPRDALITSFQEELRTYMSVFYTLLKGVNFVDEPPEQITVRRILAPILNDFDQVFKNLDSIEVYQSETSPKELYPVSKLDPAAIQQLHKGLQEKIKVLQVKLRAPELTFALAQPAQIRLDDMLKMLDPLSSSILKHGIQLSQMTPPPLPDHGRLLTADALRALRSAADGFFILLSDVLLYFDIIQVASYKFYYEAGTNKIVPQNCISTPIQIGRGYAVTKNDCSVRTVEVKPESKK